MISLFNKNLIYLIQTNKTESDISQEIPGVSDIALQKLLTGKVIPDVITAKKIADYFNRSLDIMVTDDLEEKAAKAKVFDFKFLVLDIDGVMTEGSIIYSDKGDELKIFNAKDGLAIIKLIEGGCQVGFLSSGFRKNIIERRAQILGVQHVYIGTWKKLEVLKKWCDELNIGLENVAYIGDDLNDIAIIEKVGLSACPADATELVKQKVHLILNAEGGKSCVREFVDNYLSKYTKNPF